VTFFARCAVVEYLLEEGYIDGQTAMNLLDGRNLETVEPLTAKLYYKATVTLDDPEPPPPKRRGWEFL
jgi:hypothetical protein